jgi:hypothetical protein
MFLHARTLTPRSAPMHTTPNLAQPTIADLKRTMIRIQIAALETLERCMADPEPSGNEKTDKAKSIERNRQRMAAAQALIHCRTMARELRESEAQSHRIAEDERQASKKAIYERARLRRLHRQYPGEYEDPDAPGGFAECGMLKQSLSMIPQSPEEHAQTSLIMAPQVGCRMRGRPESPSDQSADGATGGSPASAGPDKPDQRAGIARDTPRTCGANPSPQPSPARGEGAKPIPTEIG